MSNTVLTVSKFVRLSVCIYCFAPLALFAYHCHLEEFRGVGCLAESVVDVQECLGGGLLPLRDGVDLSLVCFQEQLELLELFLVRHLLEF